MPAATSFKHVSPTSAAVGIPLPDALKKAVFADGVAGLDDSLLACAYARARGTDRMSSFGDFIALSHPCDEATARLIKPEVSDGIIAPGYEPAALAILREKRKGNYTILQMDASYRPETLEHKHVFGVSFYQARNDSRIDASLLENIVTQNKELPQQAIRDLIVSLITLKYTQSNSVCFAKDGQAIGVGAGQQSRIHCTRLAAGKADLWHLRQHEKVLGLPFLDHIGRAVRDNAIDVYLSDTSDDVLADGQWQELFSKRPEPMTGEEKRGYLSAITGVSLGSDAFFPFEDNIRRAAASGTSYVAQPGGSIRDAQVIEACDARGMVMCFTGLRLFHH
jgi:AICAR transformylase/IMP cyclohydrolase PurH